METILLNQTIAMKKCSYLVMLQIPFVADELFSQVKSLGTGSGQTRRLAKTYGRTLPIRYVHLILVSLSMSTDLHYRDVLPRAPESVYVLRIKLSLRYS